MKFTSRLKFIIGILFVIAIVGALAIYLNGIMSVSQSSKAELAADSTTIGTDYPGLVVKQNVEEGDKVTKGEVLFEIQSAQLNDALTTKNVSVSSLPFSVDPVTNYIQLKANDDGVIEKISYRAGSYAPAGGIVATVNTVGSLYVIAHFHLSPPDYARVSKTNKIDLRLPDNSTQQATIFSIALVSNGSNVDTVVKARIKDADISDFRFSVGTPVQATLQLSQDGWFQGLFTVIEQLFKPLGH
ncbi:MAG TPA: HlyD family efflux transporter periplasmic adaptor subunit [Candidatus Microsaccharimonas sp.]|jgi:regulator of protease activity HflC (stomatin/prohibitin superfamily)